jgi:hypothetical protein
MENNLAIAIPIRTGARRNEALIADESDSVSSKYMGKGSPNVPAKLLQTTLVLTGHFLRAVFMVGVFSAK